MRRSIMMTLALIATVFLAVPGQADAGWRKWCCCRGGWGGYGGCGAYNAGCGYSACGGYAGYAPRYYNGGGCYTNGYYGQPVTTAGWYGSYR